MAKGRQGRARFVTAERATIRRLREADITAIDTPGKLVRLFQKLGYDTRITGKSHYMVYGSNGRVMTVPQTWGDRRSRDNTLADARRAGLLPGKTEEWELAEVKQERTDEIPKLVTEGGRPTLSYVKEETPEVSTTVQYATQQDLLELVKIVERLDARVAKLDDSVEKGFGIYKEKIAAIEKELTTRPALTRPALTRPARKRDILAEVRQEILDFLTPFGTTPRFPLSFITANLGRPDTPSSSYTGQLKKLVESGEVLQHKDRNDKSGARTMYSLAPKDEA
jgi:hypothetical protein